MFLAFVVRPTASVSGEETTHPSVCPMCSASYRTSRHWQRLTWRGGVEDPSVGERHRRLTWSSSTCGEHVMSRPDVRLRCDESPQQRTPTVHGATTAFSATGEPHLVPCLTSLDDRSSSGVVGTSTLLKQTTRKLLSCLRRAGHLQPASHWLWRNKLHWLCM